MPLDPNQPLERLAFMLEDSRASSSPADAARPPRTMVGAVNRKSKSSPEHSRRIRSLKIER